MKSHKKYFLIGILCLSFNINNYAQDEENYIIHPDTLRVDLPDGQSIDFAFEDIHHAKFDKAFIGRWVESIEKMQAIVSLDNYEGFVKIRLTNKLTENEMKDLVEVNPIVQGTNTYISRDGQLINLAKLNKLTFEIQKVKIRATLSNLENWDVLKTIDLEELQHKLAKQKEQIASPRKAYYLNSSWKKDSFTNLKIQDNGVADFIDLTGGIGAGLFRDKLVPEVSLRATITIGNKHGIHLHKFGLQSSFHYFFDRNVDKSYNMNVNTFVTAFYKKNFSKSTLKDRWAGIGVGYLVKKSGGYFGENTMKVGLLLNAHQSSIDIIPELIITDNFKTVIPSIRFGLTF